MYANKNRKIKIYIDSSRKKEEENMLNIFNHNFYRRFIASFFFLLRKQKAHTINFSSRCIYLLNLKKTNSLYTRLINIKIVQIFLTIQKFNYVLFDSSMFFIIKLFFSKIAKLNDTIVFLIKIKIFRNLNLICIKKIKYIIYFKKYFITFWFQFEENQFLNLISIN